ncbi:hypothetical protein RJ640_030949 [Escallonia rubra]|uniref:RAB6-interacting golgin n=1 Tax=Escallonia rubra TaxID=112253 RepID=A0AA88U6L2_9ASTE|nr:hypothetical protein RJ640_030949 [Escallonia rubra]
MIKKAKSWLDNFKQQGQPCCCSATNKREKESENPIIPKQKQKPEREKIQEKFKGLAAMKGEVMQQQTEAPPAHPLQPSDSKLQTLMQSAQISGSLSFNGAMTKDDEEMSKSALSTFRAKEEEIEKKKMEVKERVQLQLGRIEEETRRLANIREELEALADPMKKEVSVVRKKIDSVNKELKPLGQTCQKKEREYKEALEAFNEKNREKVQLITRLMELVSESEKLRMKKLDELSKSIETIR